MFSIQPRSETVFTIICSVSLLGGIVPAYAMPNSVGTEQLLALDHQQFSFIPPEDSGQPRTNRAGGRRDQFCNNSMPTPSLTLLLPPTNQGLTTAAHPTFLAYLPQTSAKQAFLTLEDEDDNYLYHTIFELPAGAGIIGIPIPDTAPALEADKYYKISLAMICGQVLDPNDPVVEGWIKRVELDTQSRPSQEISLELGAWYASNGIWFDTLQTLADLYEVEPDHAIAAWEALFRSVNLDDMGAAVFLGNVNNTVN